MQQRNFVCQNSSFSFIALIFNAFLFCVSALLVLCLCVFQRS
nr:MAG TPA: hypothetical protein [Caudoviricetes sp.]